MIEYKKMENQAQKDLDKKLALEKPFIKELNKIFSKMTRDYKIVVARTGTPPFPQNYRRSFTELLNNHYERVQKAFKGQVIDFNDLEVDQALKDEINFLLLQWAADTAPVQSTFITQTNANNMQDATRKAFTLNSEQGVGLDNRSIAATGAVFLRRMFKGRTENIAMFETQNASENTKRIETETIVNEIPTKPARKTWITIGDKFVRPSHRAVNGQRRDLNMPFDVGGAKMRQPGDTSLGAPLAQAANCRCTAQYSAPILQGVR